MTGGSWTADRVMLKFLTERFPDRVASSEAKQHIKNAKIMYTAAVGTKSKQMTQDPGS